MASTWEYDTYLAYPKLLTYFLSVCIVSAMYPTFTLIQYSANFGVIVLLSLMRACNPDFF